MIERFFLYTFLIVILCFQAVSCEKVEIETTDISITEPEVVLFESDSLKVTKFKVLEDWHNMQGGAIYGDYLISLTAMDEVPDGCNGFIYNLITGEKITDLSFPGILNDRKYMMPHANQVSFGANSYNSDSLFPLLYVTQGNFTDNKGLGEQGVLVYDLRYIDDTICPVLVQAIIPDMSDEVLMDKIKPFIWNWIVDKEKQRFVVIGYPKVPWVSGQPVGFFRIPDISEGSEIIMTNRDLEDYFTLSSYLGPQQSICYNNYCFSLGGYPSYGWLRVINLQKKKEAFIVDLRQWTKGEPQFFGKWRNRFLYYEAGTTGQLYEFVFKFPLGARRYSRAH